MQENLNKLLSLYQKHAEALFESFNGPKAMSANSPFERLVTNSPCYSTASVSMQVDTTLSGTYLKSGSK